MTEEMIARINFLYNKAKTEGLTDSEKEEQASLRADYIKAMRENVRAHLNSITIEDENGNRTKLSEKYGNKKGQ